MLMWKTSNQVQVVDQQVAAELARQQPCLR